MKLAQLQMKLLKLFYFALIFPTMCSYAAHHVKFKDVTKKSGLQKLGSNKASWADLNDDGWVDLISKGRIWKNLKGKRFIDVTKGSGIRRIQGTCVIADFNGDGQKDIYFVNRGGSLYLGKGDFKFSRAKAFINKAESARGACAVDIDNDGYVDVYIANYEVWKKGIGFHDIILRNDKGSLVKQWKASDKKLMRGRGATSCDFNNDGLMDIYVSNYRLMPNFLWVNEGKWKMSDKAREYGCAGSEHKNIVFKNSKKLPYRSSGHTIGSLWADFNNDTYFDLFVGNFSHPPKFQDRSMLLKNGGPDKKYHFIDKSALAKIPWQESYCSPAAADIDNDGLVDIFFNTIYPRDTGRLLRNLGEWQFEDITKQSTINVRRSYQNAFADFDNDGRIDLLSSGHLYRNISDRANWLEIILKGKAPNTSAIGAKVIIDCNGQKYTRQVEAGTGEGNQNDLRLHFGIGKYKDQIKVKVIWPNGKIATFKSKINRIKLIKQK